MPITWLHHADPLTMPPKIAHLVAARRRGLPVPPGVALNVDDSDHEWASAVNELLAAGPIIVRSALACEDQVGFSGAGLGLSVPGCHDTAAVARALEACRDARSALPPIYRDGTKDRWLIQQQIRGAYLVVAALEPEGDHIEVHRPSGDPLAQGATPLYSGPVARWPERNSAEHLIELFAELRTQPESAPYGLDLEIVITPEHAPHLVQLRPLVVPLHPGWPAFAEAVRQAGETDRLRGDLTLDAEHNPAPVSPAHAWLLEELGRARPHAGGFVTLVGWLYARTLPRDLTTSDADQPDIGDPVGALQRLHRRTLPATRKSLSDFVARLKESDRAQVAAALAEAVRACLEMLDIYLTEFIPARKGHANHIALPNDPLCLRDRERFADVLPLSWDVASPSIARDPTPDRQSFLVDTALPDDPATAATLLREWDDHLFALGIAPVRQVYLRAGQILGIGDEIFLLRGNELQAALHGTATDVGPLLARRRASLEHAAALHPPPRIIAGRPAGPPPRWLRGFPVGQDFTGMLASRANLAALRDQPPLPQEIAVLPSLTAPAALVLAELGIAAVCCEHGGAMSHGALIARELGLSALIGCRGVTTLPTGTMARIDTRTGALVILSPAPTSARTRAEQVRPDHSKM